ncbi:MAG: hypothetical protein ACLPWS_09475 [Rhodomicrobium sp.]
MRDPPEACFRRDMTFPISTATLEAAGVKARAFWFAAPLSAMVYPLTLKGFHASVAAMDTGGSHDAIVLAAAGLSLFLAFAVPAIAIVSAMRLSAIEIPAKAELLARRVALLAVAAPPLFTFTGVVLYMLGNPISDIWILAAFWAFLIVAIARSDKRIPVATEPEKPARAAAHVAHGAVALVILVVFLGAHLANHLTGLAGPDTHTAVMKTLRHVYRSPVAEPILLMGFLFLIVSGSYMAWKLTGKVTGGFRTFQIASGVYLIFFLISHVNAVLVLARAYLGVDSGWDFATGAPAGLIHDTWNIRLVPLGWRCSFPSRIFLPAQEW